MPNDIWVVLARLGSLLTRQEPTVRAAVGWANPGLCSHPLTHSWHKMPLFGQIVDILSPRVPLGTQMLTGEQLRAGRAMLGWDQSELAEKADVSVKTVKRMEATSGRIDARSTWSVKKALEIAGIEFLDGDDDWRSRGDGVRFCKDPTAKLRLAILEAMTTSLDVDLRMMAEDDEDLFERPINEIVERVVNKMREGLTDTLQHILRKDA